MNSRVPACTLVAALVAMEGLACTSEPRPAGLPRTDEEAFRPILERLDADRDGRLSPKEFQRTSYGAPPFETVDGNRDGALSVEELGALLLRLDPIRFDGVGFQKDAMGPKEQAGGIESNSPMNPHDLGQLLYLLREQVAATDPGVALPTPEELDRAAFTATLYDAGLQAMLKRLEGAWSQAGLTFPRNLIVSPDQVIDTRGDQAGAKGPPPAP